MNKCFPDEIRVRFSRFANGVRLFIMEHYFRVVTSKGLFIIPTGFETDMASIPVPFHSILSPLGEYAPAAIFHDWAYSRASNGHFPADRKMADDVFLELMYNLGVPWYTRHVIYLAVRAGGWKSYKRR